MPEDPEDVVVLVLVVLVVLVVVVEPDPLPGITVPGVIPNQMRSRDSCTGTV